MRKPRGTRGLTSPAVRLLQKLKSHAPFSSRCASRVLKRTKSADTEKKNNDGRFTSREGIKMVHLAGMFIRTLPFFGHVLRGCINPGGAFSFFYVNAV